MTFRASMKPELMRQARKEEMQGFRDTQVPGDRNKGTRAKT